MTDSNATELLRGELTAIGVEYEDAKYNFQTHITVWSVDNATFVFIDGPNHDGELHIENCTPEQAIAATLGRPTFDANLEQALSFMRIWISDDAHLGESELSAAFEKAEGLRKLDAIESAIAATLGGDDKSRWFQLFGTPERAAVTLIRTSDEHAVCKLPTWTASSSDYEAWLEWLGGEDA